MALTNVFRLLSANLFYFPELILNKLAFSCIALGETKATQLITLYLLLYSTDLFCYPLTKYILIEIASVEKRFFKTRHVTLRNFAKITKKNSLFVEPHVIEDKMMLILHTYVNNNKKKI